MYFICKIRQVFNELRQIYEDSVVSYLGSWKKIRTPQPKAGECR